MVLDPQALRGRERTTVTLKVKDMVLEDALRKVVKLAGLRYDLLDEALFISTTERLAEVRQREEARRLLEARASRRGGWDRERAMKGAFDKKVSFEFVETPLSEAVSFLQTLTKVSMILDPEATGGREKPVNLRVSNMTLGPAFRWILRLAGLEYSIGDDAVRIFMPGERPPTENEHEDDEPF